MLFHGNQRGIAVVLVPQLRGPITYQVFRAVGGIAKLCRMVFSMQRGTGVILCAQWTRFGGCQWQESTRGYEKEGKEVATIYRKLLARKRTTA